MHVTLYNLVGSLLLGRYRVINNIVLAVKYIIGGDQHDIYVQPSAVYYDETLPETATSVFDVETKYL